VAQSEPDAAACDLRAVPTPVLALEVQRDGMPAIRGGSVRITHTGVRSLDFASRAFSF